MYSFFYLEPVCCSNVTKKKKKKRKHSEKLTDHCRLKEMKEKWKLNAVCGPGLSPAQVETSVVMFNIGKVSPI